jgi:hypothetical protein
MGSDHSHPFIDNDLGRFFRSNKALKPCFYGQNGKANPLFVAAVYIGRHLKAVACPESVRLVLPSAPVSTWTNLGGRTPPSQVKKSPAPDG